jgi:DNA-binding transcriptional ArsR family regulator
MMRRDVFQAIADPTRREIINLIAYKRMNVNTVAENFEMSRPAISKHMKILEECGLVMMEQQGRERYCKAQLKPLHEVSDWVSRYKKEWEERLDEMEKYIKELQAKDKGDEQRS